jgi:hypothetical protein
LNEIAPPGQVAKIVQCGEPRIKKAVGTRNMGSIERELNEYLFLEFGMEEEEEALISESWPFNLCRLGEIGDTTR